MCLKRDYLYNRVYKVAKDTNKEAEFKRVYPTMDDWINTRFKDTDSVKKTFDIVIKNKILASNWTIEQFYTTFVCDMDWAKNLLPYCGTGTNNDPIDDTQNTITNSEILKKLKVGGDKFWNEIKVGIPSIIQTSQGYVYDKVHDLEKWWKNYKKEHGNSSSTTNDWLPDPNKSKMYVYKVKDCKWLAKNVKTGKIFIISDNTAYQSSIDILNKSYPNALKDCNNTNTPVVDTTPANLPTWANCLKVIKNLSSSKDSKSEDVVIAPFDNDFGYFWEDKSFVYVSKDGTKSYGNWSCDNNTLVINKGNGEVWTPSSGWKNTPDKTINPDQNFGTSWTSPDELTGGSKPKPNPFAELSKTKIPVSINQNESTMNNLENIIKEIDELVKGELISEQTTQIVQAPKDEINILKTNSLLTATGTLEALCRSQNQTSLPVNVNNKIYFVGKKITLKTTNTPAYLTYDGMVLQKIGNSCNFNYMKDANGLMHIKGIPFSDLELPQTEVLLQFGIDPKNGDPYYTIDTLTVKLQDLINKGARSPIFKNWDDMLTYWYPDGSKRLTASTYEKYKSDPRITYNYPRNYELNQYPTIVKANDLGLRYLGKEIQIYLPAGGATTTTSEKISRDPNVCRQDLINYLKAAFEFQQVAQKDESIDINVTRKALQGCYRTGQFQNMTGITYSDLGVEFVDKDNPFKGARGFGNDIDFEEAKKLLIGNKFKLSLVGPSGKNPYLNFYIDRRDTMNESKIKLNNLIKENLTKLSEEKQNNLLAENRIIQTRTKILLENRILKFKQPREKFFNEIISESIYLEKQGFDKELIKEEFWGKIKGLFGDHGSEAIFGTFKEYMSKWLVGKLTSVNPNGWMGTAIKKSVKDIHVEDIDKLTDCEFMTKRVSLSITNEIVNKVKNDEEVDGGISNIVKGGLTKSIDRTELLRNIESGVSKIICPELGNVGKKLEDKAEEMKLKAIRP